LVGEGLAISENEADDGERLAALEESSSAPRVAGVSSEVRGNKRSFEEE
jgi:hypothetical protein